MGVCVSLWIFAEWIGGFTVNAVKHFLDASIIYGTEKLWRTIRRKSVATVDLNRFFVVVVVYLM